MKDVSIMGMVILAVVIAVAIILANWISTKVIKTA
jgi:uncharacterized membrane protein YcaP (DUF421 family)